MPNRSSRGEPTFAQQLERVATAATVATKLSTLETHLAAARQSNKASWQRIRGRIVVAKRTVMAAAFATAFLQYYFLSVTAQIMEMQPVAFGAARPAFQSSFLKTSESTAAMLSRVNARFIC